jgi:flagellar motor switch protein FliN/FliY
VFDVPVKVSAVLDAPRWTWATCSTLTCAQARARSQGVGEAIDIYVNDRLVARGEVVLVEDKLGITMTEIIKAERN